MPHLWFPGIAPTAAPPGFTSPESDSCSSPGTGHLGTRWTLSEGTLTFQLFTLITETLTEVSFHQGEEDPKDAVSMTRSCPQGDAHPQGWEAQVFTPREPGSHSQVRKSLFWERWGLRTETPNTHVHTHRHTCAKTLKSRHTYILTHSTNKFIYATYSHCL